MCTRCSVNAMCFTECVRAFISQKFPSLNNLTSLSSSIHWWKRSFPLTAVGLCTEFPLFSLSADQSICPSSIEQRCRVWKRDKTNRTNALPPEHGITYIAQSMIKSQKESLSLEDLDIPSPPLYLLGCVHKENKLSLVMWESSFENSHFPPATKCYSEVL